MDDDGGIKNYYGYVNKLRPPRFVEPRRGLVKAMARRAKMSHLGAFQILPEHVVLSCLARVPREDHDAVGEWKRLKPPASPGFLGGAMMARVSDTKLGKGVLHFGGIVFPPGSTQGLAESNSTRFWPASSCP